MVGERARARRIAGPYRCVTACHRPIGMKPLEEDGLNTERRVCSACGSPIVSLADEDPDLAFLHAGTMDDASWFEPELEIWTCSAQPWAQHFEQAARHERGVD